MADFLFLVPVALILGALGLAAFMWALSNGQYDDIEGAAERVLFDDDKPLRRTPTSIAPRPTSPVPGEPPAHAEGRGEVG
jgi:cbb3-type cytochrome oxidase maturation protein